MLEYLPNKVAGLQPCNFIKNRLQHKCLPLNIAKFFSTEQLRTTASLVKVHRIISFRIIRKIIVNRKDKGLTRKELRHRYLRYNFPRFLKVILDGVFQKFITAGTKIVNISNEISSITSVDAFIAISGRGDIFNTLDLKSEIFAGISFRKVSGFCYK